MKCWYCEHPNDDGRETCASCGRRLWKSIDAFFRLKKPLKVYYFSYGYSRNPIEMTRKVQKMVLKILEKRRDIVPVVPHFIFDVLIAELKLDKDRLVVILPIGYSYPEVSHWEVEIISRCDGVVYSKEMSDSAGVKWEVAVAQKLSKPVFTYEEVLDGRDVE